MPDIGLKRKKLKLMSFFILVTASIFASACSSLNTINNSESGINTVSMSGSFGEPDETNRSTRVSTSIESGVSMVGKALLVDPVLRPFTTIKALFGYTLKSTAGFLERTFIEHVRFPNLEAKPIPGLSNLEPMNLEHWEQDLDTLIDSESSSGTIKYLIDGEQYFSRLNQAIGDSCE